MMDQVVDAQRWIVFLLACWNTPWAVKGAIALARGNFWPPAFYGSVVFWFGVGASTFAVGHAFGSTDLWKMFAFLPIITALSLAAIAQRRGTLLRAERFYGIYAHLDEALAIASLAAVDPPSAARLADECRRLAAATMVARNA